MDIKVLDPTGIYWRSQKSSIKWRIFVILKKNHRICSAWTPLEFTDFSEDFHIFGRNLFKWSRCLSWTPPVSTDLRYLSRIFWVNFLEFLHPVHQNVRARSHGSVLKIFCFVWRILSVLQNVRPGPHRGVLKINCFSVTSVVNKQTRWSRSTPLMCTRFNFLILFSFYCYSFKMALGLDPTGVY